MAQLLKTFLEELTLKQSSIGDQSNNKETIKKQLYYEFMECEKEFKEGIRNLELQDSFYKLSKLFDILQVFDLEKEEISQIQSISVLIRKILFQTSSNYK